MKYWQRLEAADRYEAHLGDPPAELGSRQDISVDELPRPALHDNRPRLSQEMTSYVGQLGARPSLAPLPDRSYPEA